MKSKKTTLKHIDDSALEIERKRSGRGYTYFDSSGNKITSKSLLKRIKKIVIPPMWSEVKICKFDDGHIQATGRDAKGRKQYIYHSDWERQQQEKKFERLLSFGEQLPKIRKQCQDDLDHQEWDKDKVTALVVSLLDEYGVRIGNNYYKENNETYGLTTLRRKHLSEKGKNLKLNYKGKSGKERSVTIEDDQLSQFIHEAAEMPGYEIFRYTDDDNESQTVDSSEVNEYITKYLGDEFSSKDFRTWAGTRLAVELYPEAIQLKEDSRKKMDNILIRLVADELGNTPSICKTYYIHPKILHHINNKSIPKLSSYQDSDKNYGLSAEEKIMLKLLEEKN
ncbi:DNA topoisomerase IB [Marivirga sp.]|uniref:DNA topoisomerase IB n=1 Tax=Marivirga sp. TaxID=2018662 RepID=UPI002D7EDAE4|nr:DNA topoisomerase IB [Marivirga sp.]HET8861140.1 DNA topoisomerase IB [Marivirga sp.]